MEKLIRVMPMPLKQYLQNLQPEVFKQLEEIRLRIGKPILLKIREKEYSLSEFGLCEIETGYIIKEAFLKTVLQYMCDFSLYAIEDEIKEGFLTIEGGHRVGIAGKVVMEAGQIKTIKTISSINIRVSHEILGCSKHLIAYLLTRSKVYHTLIISPPGCGKTTLLRDIICQLSNGFCGYGPYTVGVVDERGEIAACYHGMSQNDLGMRTDVLDACPKALGMKMLLRSMAPDVVAVDEIGKAEDAEAVLEMINSGVSVICTVHGRDLEECKRRLDLKSVLEKEIFERAIMLSAKNGPCTLEGIMDLKTGRRLL